MRIETVTLKGFRCFGPEGATIELDQCLTALVGANGTGKTTLMLALSRCFGVTTSERRATLRDFHMPPGRQELESGDQFSIDAVFSFPELEEDGDKEDAVPEFFRQMVVGEPNAAPMARMILIATWTDDGTPAGSIEEDIRWIPSLGDDYKWDQCQKVQAVERGSIQLVYVPASRNVESQVTALLKGRLWQAARWSEDFRTAVTTTSDNIQQSFQDEEPSGFVLQRLSRRWTQLYQADTDSTPSLRLVEKRFEDIVRKADFVFFPDEAGGERSLSDLSDGQRSLFHIALTAATLEVERDAFAVPADDCAFDQEKLRRACLTILAVEEPENSLSPFFLSRIITQAREIGVLETAQVVLSSHSASILGRVEPEEVRYFCLDRAHRSSKVTSLTLPEDNVEASAYVRLAVRAYPELYFARFVILGEGDSEQLVVPRIAEAMGVPLDPSFVPIVPLGGRHVEHFWRLLNDLNIPHATLLDLDMGRSHGGAKAVRLICSKLEEVGRSLNETASAQNEHIDPDDLGELTDQDIWLDYEENSWILALEELGVYFSDPLDLDFSMLESFPRAYQRPHSGGRGPREGEEALKAQKAATLKRNGDATIYQDRNDDEFRWYPYLFLSKSKPETHLTALSRISGERLARRAPAPLKSLINHVKENIDPDGAEA